MMMTMTELAAELRVDRRQVWTWHHRRERNGFPPAVRTVVRFGRTVPVWHLHEVLEWRKTYKPAPGGRPKTKA